MNFSTLDSLFSQHLNHTSPAAQIEIRFRGEIVYSQSFGLLDPEIKSRETNNATRFDLASVSKLFTAATFMTLVKENRVALDQRVCEVLPEFVGERAITAPLQPGASVKVVPTTNARADASRVTFRNLLAHNAGLPAWLPLWKIDQREKRCDAASVLHCGRPTPARRAIP